MTETEINVHIFGLFKKLLPNYAFIDETGLIKIRGYATDIYFMIYGLSKSNILLIDQIKPDQDYTNYYNIYLIDLTNLKNINI